MAGHAAAVMVSTIAATSTTSVKPAARSRPRNMRSPRRRRAGAPATRGGVEAGVLIAARAVADVVNSLRRREEWPALERDPGQRPFDLFHDLRGKRSVEEIGR